MMLHKLTYRSLIGMLALLALAGSVQALDLQAYSPARNDAIRNGLYLVFGPEAGKYASVELPAAHKAVANVYDFRACPVNTGYRQTAVGRGRTEYLVDKGDEALGGAGDTVYYTFTLTDTSRLDSARVADGTVIFNRMMLETVSGAAGAGGYVFRDRNRNGRRDSGEEELATGTPFSMVPGEILNVGLAVTIPAGGMSADTDTVSLVCRTDLNRPDKRQLSATFKNVVRSRGPVYVRNGRKGVPGPLAMLTEYGPGTAKNGLIQLNMY